MTTKETKYYSGNMEISKDTYERTFDSHSNSVTTETDWWGREKVTKKDCFGTHTYKRSGFSDDGFSEGAVALGGMLGTAVVPLFLAGGVIYGAGKLIYHIATIQKRKREAEELRLYQIESYKTSFQESVERILSKNNQKLGEYKELFDLGILSESEYNTHVEFFIKTSNEEIDKEKQYLAKKLEELSKKK